MKRPEAHSTPKRTRTHLGFAGKLVLFCLPLQACGGGTPTPAAQGSEGASPETTTGATALDAAPAATSTAAAGATPAPSVAGSSATEAPPSPFTPWAQFPTEVKLAPVGDAALIVGPHPVDGNFTFSFLLLSSSGEISSPEGLNMKSPVFAEFQTAAGEWPKSAFMSFITGNGRVGWSQVSQATGRGWKDISANSPRWVDLSVQRWDKGRVLALAVDQFGFDRKPPTFRVVSGTPTRPVPKLARSSVPMPKDGSPGCLSAIVPESFAATPLGHVFVTGPLCADDKPGAKLEYFAPGATKSQTFDITEHPLGEMTAAARAVDDVYLSGTGGPLLHFDGKTITKVSEVPVSGPVSLSAEGTLWVNSGDKLYKQVKGGKWESIALPPKAVASALYVPTDAQPFVLVGKTLYGLSEPPGGVKQYQAEFGQKPTTLSLPKAANPECQHLYALLYGFTKVTPDDYDFPLTRKAIKGQAWLEETRFVVTEDNGKKFFGAIPNDYEVGKRLVAHVQKQVKGSVPVLLCANPKVVRELPIDLRTGEVRK
ncbi:MAG: hypothetical protein H6718_22270 [Polyangiaceae bacterium]|nr:hypothetical protein [Polyangiaceae bacterium]